MVHPAAIPTSPTCNPDEVDNSDGGESESIDSHDATIEESETDKEKDKATSLSLQRTLKEALRVAAAQRQMQKNKAKNNSNNDNCIIASNNNNNNNNNNNSNDSSSNNNINNSNTQNGPTGAITTCATNAQATAAFPLLAPFLLPGLSSAPAVGTSNAIMYQIPQGVIYTNEEGVDNSSALFVNGAGNSTNPTSKTQQTNPQFMFPINSLTLQQSLLQMMSTAALSAVQLDNSERSS